LIKYILQEFYSGIQFYILQDIIALFARILSELLQELDLKSCKINIFLARILSQFLQELVLIVQETNLASKILHLARYMNSCKSYLARSVQVFVKHLQEKDHFDCKTCKSCNSIVLILARE